MAIVTIGLALYFLDNSQIMILSDSTILPLLYHLAG